jgi:presenilin-like A22 family membrane protease
MSSVAFAAAGLFYLINGAIAGWIIGGRIIADMESADD